MNRLHSLIREKQKVVLTSVVGILAAFAAWSAFAQEAPQSDQEEKIQQSIRKALQGESEIASADEPLLQDVLDLIKRQGSVLDGSILNKADETTTPAGPPADHDAHYRTAEALLKAARMLRSLHSDVDSDRETLIGQMRHQAMCLLQAACGRDQTSKQLNQ